MSRNLKLLVLSIVLALAVFVAVPALAGSQPSLSQVKREITHMDARIQLLNQQYDTVRGQLATVVAERKMTAAQVASERTVADKAQAQVSSIAINMYENGDTTNPLLLLTEKNAMTILAKGQIMQELSDQDTIIVRQFLAELALLKHYQLLEYRQQVGANELAAQARKIRAQADALQHQEDALLGIYPSLAPWPPGYTTGTYHGTTKTQAGKAVAFAYAQLGCPYLWGGTGPCHTGFDCSGLMVQAWAYAGVSIPRTSEAQWAGLPAVAPSEMRPGDLIIMLGGAHVGMYVGNGWMIDAPHTGAWVERIRYAGWPQAATVGIVRP